MMENRYSIKANKQVKQKPQNEKLCMYQYADVTAKKNKNKPAKTTKST